MTEIDKIENPLYFEIMGVIPLQAEKRVELATALSEALQDLILREKIAELKSLTEDWDMAEREPGDNEIHEYKDFETIKERITELQNQLKEGL